MPENGSHSRSASELQQVSQAMVRLYKDLFGRGPTKVRSNYAGPDTLISTVENSLTQAERNMAENGDHQRLRDVRMYFQHASEGEFCSTIEEITGRKVVAFVSGICTYTDTSAEVFYLEPRASDGDGDGSEP